MKYLTPFLLGLLSSTAASELAAQDSLNHEAVFPEGISVEYGTGSYAVTDEYISKEKYSGSLPYYKIGFANPHEGYVYQIGIEFRTSSEVDNYNVSATVYQFSLNQGFLYPLPRFSLFSKEAFAFVGPSTEVFVYTNKQDIAVSGFDYAQSFAGLFSLGVNSHLIYPLSSSFHVAGSLNVSLLSLAFRMVDTEETDDSPVKVLTLFAGLHGSFRLGMRYHLLSNLSANLSYLFDVTRIGSWDPLYAASDSIVLAITYGF